MEDNLRGFTSPLIWFDEFAFLKYNGIVFAAASPALSKASESAERNGTPYGKTISTTPNDRDSYEGAYAYSILDSAVKFDNSWYDLTLKDIKRIIDTKSNNNFVYIKFSYKELGRSEAWFRNQCRELNNDLMKIKRELLLEWTLANDRSPFTEEQLDDISKFIKEKPVNIMYFKKIYPFSAYEELTDIFTTNWIIAIDIGGGMQQDFTVISIINPQTKKLTAIYKSNNILSTELIELIEDMLSTFMPNAVIVPERNSLGIAILDLMAKSNIIRPRLYYEIKERVAERVVGDPKLHEISKTKNKVQVYGQTTDKKSRDIMFNEILAYMVEYEKEAFICPELFDELRTLERNNRGRIEARIGCHDDVIMSYLIGLYALLYGRNINKFVKLGLPSYIANTGDIISSQSERYVKGINQLYGTLSMPLASREFLMEERRKQDILEKMDEEFNKSNTNINNKEKNINRNIRNLLKK